MFDLNFTFPLNWGTFVMGDFVSFSFGGSIYTQSSFNVTYLQTDLLSYRVSMQPYSYAFIINQSVTITTRLKPTTFNYTSSDDRPFMDSVFNKSLTVIWTYLKPPSMTDTEYSVISTLSTLSTSINQAFYAPGVQEIKKFGFLLLVLNSMQVTSCLLLINTILPANLYEGIRFFASLIFFDTPEWEADSTARKYFLTTPISDISARRLLSSNVNEFYFRRTGFTGMFIFDAYSQVFMIVVCYLLLGGCLLSTRVCKRMARVRPYLETVLDSFHEIAIMYFTISIVFSFVYSGTSTLRWVSMGVCILVNVYYFLYQIKIYYALLSFPDIPLNDPRF